MGDCKFCSRPAGFLRRSHKECNERFQDGRNEIIAATISAIRDDGDFTTLKERVSAVAMQSFVDRGEQQRLLITAWERAVDQFLEDGVLDAEEETRLARCKNYFLLNDVDLDRNGRLTKTVKAGTLRDVLEGKIPKRVTFDGGVALNLQKNEQIIWAFPQTEYLEDKTRRHYVGRSQGVSIRVMKGVYYRTSAFKGHPVEHTERVMFVLSIYPTVRPS